jgi:hypothetical protein
METAENRNLFQIYITDREDDLIPHSLLDCIKANNERRNQLQHFVLRNREIEAFLSREFDPEVLKAYQKLRPYAYKADLARYCLLFRYGGWYLDITVRLQELLPSPAERGFCVFREPAGAGDTPWGVNTACLYARNGERFLEMAIVRILENCRNEYYGSSCLNITGPGLFGKMLALYAREEDGFVGDYLQLTPCHPRKNMAFVLPDGRILAFGKVTAGSTQSTGLEAFGAAGTNSYPQLWAAREVYAGGIC